MYNTQKCVSIVIDSPRSYCRFVTSNLKLGIISGGQLGKMLIQEASKWDIISYVMDKDEHCPARKIANHFFQGDNLDFDSVYRFGKLVDILTFEIENVNIEALKILQAEGLRITPDPAILELINDKGSQKLFYLKNGLPTSEFLFCESKASIIKGIKETMINYPFVQKLRKGGYDGRGVALVRNEGDLVKLLNGPSIIEKKIEIAKEISVIAARNERGEVSCYPAAEMFFDQNANLVDTLICPSSISVPQSEKAASHATEIIEKLGMEGLLAVEFFVDTSGELLINEVSPRPHNSGHHTIESTITSQFEQHLRAVLNLPLGSTKIKLPSVMINILGMEGHEGPVRYEGLSESLAIEGVKIHLYGKKETRAYRKMGHVTVLSQTMDSALEKADKVRKLIKVKTCREKL